MKRTGLAVLLIAILVFTSSCRFTSFDTDTLLTPPQMNATNQEVRKCISEAIGSSYELVYPKSGSYQTAISSADITGNGVNEAVCFYTSGTDKSVNFIVLEIIADVWTVIGTSKSQATAVERVAFCDLDGDKRKEIIIGWQYLMGEEKAIEIYSVNNANTITSLYTGMYNSFLTVGDCVVTISRNTSGKTASAALIGISNGSVGILNTVSLNNSITGFISVQSGTINENVNAIYIDEQLESLLYTTEVLAVNEKNELTMLIPSLSNQTMRTRAVTCADINGDKQPDIPVERPFSGYVNDITTENLVYIDWYSCHGSELQLISSAYTSVNEQFMLELPQSWRDMITVQRSGETERAVHFYYKQDNATLIPMFSLRVFSQQEYTETVQSQGWQTIKTVSENVYTYRSDGSELPAMFYTSLDGIKSLFKLLS